MKIHRAAGIDLGTTNSAVAVLLPDGSDIVMLEDKYRRKTIPSMVGFNPTTELLVIGHEAWNRRAMTPAPVSSIKRKMGSHATVAVGPHKMLPEEVSARILERLTRDMQAFVDERVEDAAMILGSAVITVPAYFDAPQIEATRKAGELAGLQVLGLLQEPTAAALYYAWKHGIGDATFLVYDLGGGTFDVSVIRCMLGEYQVLGIHGDNYLGGDDFDRRLAEYFRRHLVEQGYSLDLDIAQNADDATRFLLLVRLAQEVKEALSTSEIQYVARRDIFDDKDGQPVTLELEFSREQFEELIEPLIDDSIKCCLEALAISERQGDVRLADVDHVLLVGGSTRVPLVQQKIAAALCGPERSRAAAPLVDEPDTCVALGAAIHAGNLGGLTLLPEDETATARVRLSSSLGTSEPHIYLAGELQQAPEAVKTAVLLDPHGEVAAIVRVDHEDGVVAFAFEQVATPDEGRYDFSLEFCNAAGDALVSFPVWVRRHPPHAIWRPTGSALSNPSVLAKDIYLDVVRDGRASRQLLLSHGTSLPAEGKYRFFTADRSGAVLLRLFQNRFPIRTIHLDVPTETPVGTPIDLSLTVDAAMTMVCNGEVLGQTFWAQIEPPPARELKNWTQIETLLDETEATANKLWGNEARIFRDASDPLIAGIREAARTDPDKLQVLVSRLEDIVFTFHQREADLTPAFSRMETLLDSIRRLVFREEGQSRHLGIGQQDWQQRIDSLDAEAKAAYQAHDQPAWTRAFNRVQATWESLAQDEYRFRVTDPAEHVRTMHVTLANVIEELRYGFESFPISSNPETRQLQQKELENLKRALDTNVAAPYERLSPDTPVAQAKPELDRLFEATSHIRHQFDKLPNLGLVRS
ncbi:MAG: Hsp70 family protein [Bradymonadaceae bacterium]|nr:Hsp70 family protein [Lujinxingiaceae bacterium]